MNNFKAVETRHHKGVDCWSLLPNGYPEDETDSKSDSFGGPVFATYFTSHCVIDNDIIPQQFRKGLTPTGNTFPTFNSYQFFKKYQKLNLQFFQQQLHWLWSDTIVFVLCPYPACRISCYPALIKAQEVVSENFGNFS